MTRKRIAIAAALGLCLAGGAGLYAAGRHRAGMRRVPTRSVGISPKAWAIAPGRLVYAARATGIGYDHKPKSISWWVVTVRHLFPEGGHEAVFTREFTEPKYLIHTAQGEETTAELPDTMVPMILPPGDYKVFIELRHDTGVTHLDGTHEESMRSTGQSTGLVAIR